MISEIDQTSRAVIPYSSPVEETTVDFWRVIEGAVPRLVQMDLSIPVMRGAHVARVQP